MNVTGAAHVASVVFSHEGAAMTLSLDDHSLLEDDVAVCHLQRVGVAEVDLVLPDAVFFWSALFSRDCTLLTTDY